MNIHNLVDEYLEISETIDIASKHIIEKKPADLKVYLNFRKLGDKFDQLGLQIMHELRKSDSTIALCELVRVIRRNEHLFYDQELFKMRNNYSKL